MISVVLSGLFPVVISYPGLASWATHSAVPSGLLQSSHANSKASASFARP